MNSIEDRPVLLSIGGHCGTAKVSIYNDEHEGLQPTAFCGYSSRWASHTGYRNLEIESSGSYDAILDGALDLYHQSVAAPYLVGKADCELWSYVSREIGTGHAQIRLPAFASKVIREVITDAGFVETRSWDGFWIHPEASKGMVVEALRPLLEPGSRLANEWTLAERLRRQIDYSGLGCWPLQMALF